MVLGTNTGPLVMLVALSAPDLNTGICMLCQRNQMAIYSKPQIQTSHSSYTCWIFMSWWGMTQSQHLTCTGRRRLWWLWNLEAFTKDTNTHDKIGKPLLKSPTSMISCKGWGSIPSESVWSRATTWSGQMLLQSSLSTGFELRTLPSNSAALQYHAFHTVKQWVCDEISACTWCWQDRDGWLVAAETDNPVAPDNLCNVSAKLHVAKHVDAGRQD